MNILKSSFYPINTLKGKKNFRITYRINRDGTIIELIQLQVSNIYLREEIIHKHYLSLVKRNFDKFKNILFVSRDMPWDFTYRDNTNNSEFNIEITSISENDWKFEKMKREEKMLEVCKQEYITIKELQKYLLWIGEEIDAKYEKYTKEELVPNPFYNSYPKIYVSQSHKEDKSIEELIIDAIERKNKKNHDNKDQTILIIDNRNIIFGIEELKEAVIKLFEDLQKNPFPEIYFYNGYYSEDDGSNAEYSFIPFKLPDSMWGRLTNLRTNNQDIIYQNDNVNL